MVTNCNFLVVFALFIFFIKCSFAALEVKETNLTTGLDSKSSLPLDDKNSSTTKPNITDSVLDPVRDDKVKKGEHHEEGSQGVVKNDSVKSNLSSQLNTKKGSALGTDKHNLSKESPGKERGKNKSNEASESNLVSKAGTMENVLDPSTTLRKENSRGEECDSSNKCSDEKNKLVACLRVPGNELKVTKDLEIHFWNKGKGSITVKISAPDFVKLERTTVQLQDKEDKKVKVSIGNGGGADDTLMVLTAGDGRCSLELRDLIEHSWKRIDYNSKSSYIYILKRSPSIAYISFAAILMIAAAWMCARFRRGHLSTDGYRYQKLEVELPVSGGGKTESEVIDGWDDSWGDSWDDEEAPKTPSKPVTPSLSSKGLASRRFSKDGWKD